MRYISGSRSWRRMLVPLFPCIQRMASQCFPFCAGRKAPSVARAELHGRQVARGEEGHRIADPDETFAVNRDDAGELPAAALERLLKRDSVGHPERLADVRTRLAGAGEFTGDLPDAQQRAGRQCFQCGELDGDLLPQVARPQAQGLQRGAVDDEDLPAASGLLLPVHVAFEPKINQGFGPTHRLRLPALLDEDLQTDHSAAGGHGSRVQPLHTSYHRSPGRSNLCSTTSDLLGPPSNSSMRRSIDLLLWILQQPDTAQQADDGVAQRAGHLHRMPSLPIRDTRDAEGGKSRVMMGRLLEVASWGIGGGNPLCGTCATARSNSAATPPESAGRSRAAAGRAAASSARADPRPPPGRLSPPA